MLRNRRQNGGSPRYTHSPTSSPSGSPRIIVTRSIGGSPRSEVGEIDTRSPFQSVRAAVTLFGETATASSPIKPNNKPKKSKTAEERVQEKDSQLNLALRELDSFKQQIRSTETTKGHALRELQNAKTTLQELTNQLQTLCKSKQAAIQETQAANARATQLDLSHHEINIAHSMQSLRKAKEEEEKKFDSHHQLVNKNLVETNKGIQVLREQLNNVRALDLDSFTKASSELDLTKNKLQDIAAEKRLLRSLVDSLQAELDSLKGHKRQLKKKADEAETLAENLRLDLDNSKKDLQQKTTKGDAIQQFTSEAVQFLKEAEEMKKKVELLRHEAVTARAAAKEAEERLKLALREAQETKAAEKIASDEIHNSSITEGASDGKIKLAVEKYKAFSKKVEEIRNEADTKVTVAMSQVETINANEKEVLMKVEAGLKEKQDMEVAIKDALEVAEMAEADKKAVEGQLRKKASKAARKRRWRIF